MIDTTFDFRRDSNGKDPDSHSPTLRKYHQLLWSKALPTGHVFHLDAKPGRYLSHQSELGDYILSSDSVVHTYGSWRRTAHITGQLPKVERAAFEGISYTIGGMMIFPGNRVDGKNTINGERGLKRTISDRIDLTLECVRRHYLGQASPLDETLRRYSGYFTLFADFYGFVNFFHLNDLLDEKQEKIEFLLPFNDFQTSPTPTDLRTYKEYRRLTIKFLVARNARIADWAAAQSMVRQSAFL